MERTLVKIINATANDRLDHELCTLRDVGPLAGRLPPTVPITALNTRGSAPATSIRLAGLIRRSRPDIVHARNWGTWTDAAIACRLAGCPPLILSFHGLQSDAGFSPRDRRRARWLRRANPRFVCVSQTGRNQLVEQLRLDPNTIDVVPNGVDHHPFEETRQTQRDAARAQLDIPPDATVIGTVGWLTAVKDHATLLAAVACVRQSNPGCQPLRLLLIGDGPLEADLRDQARRTGLEDIIIFAGRRDDAKPLLPAIDVYVSSSVSEGMSNAILEAMAAALPIVATDVGDNRTILDIPTAGNLSPPRSPDAMADAIRALLIDPARRARLGRRARARVRTHYAFTATVDRYVALYNALVGMKNERLTPLATAAEPAP